jgi:hypothetical protein
MLKFNVVPPTLVVAGAWNPDILTPKWVASNALEMQLDQNFPVKVELPIGNPTQRPTFEFSDIRYLSAKNALTFYLVPDDPDQLNKSIFAATKILDLLSHTPTTGFGFNFLYEIEEPTQSMLGTFSSNQILAALIDDVDAETVKREWKSSVKTQEMLISLSTAMEGNKVVLNFNVHFEVTTAVAASEKLKTPNLFNEIKTKIDSIAKKLNELGEEP